MASGRERSINRNITDVEWINTNGRRGYSIKACAATKLQIMYTKVSAEFEKIQFAMKGNTLTLALCSLRGHCWKDVFSVGACQ